MNNYDVKDLAQAEGGRRRIDWAEREMPVLRSIRERFKKEKPLKGVKILITDPIRSLDEAEKWGKLFDDTVIKRAGR